MRLLFFGDLAMTGFGTVTNQLGLALLARGEDVRFLSLNEYGTLEEPFLSRTFQLGQSDGWIHTPSNAEEAAKVLALMRGLLTGESWPDDWTPDAAILLGDFEATRRSGWHQYLPDGFPAFHYVPIEGMGLPPRWREFWDHVTPVAMSHFGADEIAKVTGVRPEVVYHGVNPAFRPVSVEHAVHLETRDGTQILRTREACRKFFGGDPDRIWLYRADRHMPRKQYNALLRALVPVFATRLDVDLVLHLPADPAKGDFGGNIHDSLSKMPPWFQKRVFFTDLIGAPVEVLRALYCAADLYVSNSAEGFGLTIAEALACGIPAVGVRYSSVPEVIGPAGVTVREGNLYDNEYDHFWWHADERAFGKAVLDLCNDHLLRRILGAKGPDHVRKSFRWDEAAASFSRIIGERLAQEIAV